jgi:hypothetical protein
VGKCDECFKRRYTQTERSAVVESTETRRATNVLW